MFFFKKKTSSGSSRSASFHYDPETQEPALRCSICTGEQVAGFRNRQNGSFIEVMLIRSPADLEDFRAEYGIRETEIPRFY